MVVGERRGIRERVLEGIRGYSDYRVLAQLGFGLARVWLGFDNNLDP